MTNITKLSNKETTQINEFIKAMFEGKEGSIGSLLGFKPVVIGNKEDVLNLLHNNNDLSKTMEQSISKETELYTPQIGDEVIILNSIEGVKNVKGIIVDEVKGMEQFLIKLSELNALYVDKDKVQVIKKKQNIEETKKLKVKIEKLKDCKDNLIDEIQFITEQIKDLEDSKINIQQDLKQTTKDMERYKQQFEQLEGTNNEI
ncbi:hypothetical protein G8V07_14355 [Clostridium botulinum D/C]|uniref:hypothetical protein n=1 Tax=Clostridium botulinum TaxID=1491 RepID=UPI001E5EADFB|nr:hypothetical protein [Clostridium botulinum]MCD3321628.1 hypothetical protein [Clostridium botulinum D/C]MCD3324907.1 hypothetical protein [Clostridium botulinum D/C]MCD3328154.1 hypothetical protein [Clostridium botulinum D/C]